MHLQLEVIRQDIQDTTSDYFVNIPTPNKNIMDTADETINYIEAFFQAYHYYLGPTATPTSQISYPYAPEHLTTDLRSEVRADAAATSTASVPNARSTATRSTLDPKAPVSYPPEDPSNFLSTLPYEKPKEEPTSDPDYTSSDSPRVEPSSLIENSPYGKPTEELHFILNSNPNVHSTRGYKSSLPYIFPSDIYRE